VELAASHGDIVMTGSIVIPVYLDESLIARICTQPSAPSHCFPIDRAKMGHAYLAIEGVRGEYGAIILEIFLCDSDNNRIHVGTEGLYGLRVASSNEERTGLTLTEDITENLSAVLRNIDRNYMEVFITPRLPLPPAVTLQIKRAVIYLEME